MVKKGKGWFYEYPEHALAAKGIRTKLRLPKGKNKIKTVMREFKHHELHSGRDGLVTSRKQAVAIALSEQRKADERKEAGAAIKKALGEGKFSVFGQTSAEEKKELAQEKKEHPWATEKQAEQIVKDHEKAEKERSDFLYFKTHAEAEKYQKGRQKFVSVWDDADLIFLPESKYNPTKKFAIFKLKHLKKD